MNKHEGLSSPTRKELQSTIEGNRAMSVVVAAIGGGALCIARFLEQKTGGQIYDSIFAAGLFGWSTELAHEALAGARQRDATTAGMSDALLISTSDDFVVATPAALPRREVEISSSYAEDIFPVTLVLTEEQIALMNPQRHLHAVKPPEAA